MLPCPETEHIPIVFGEPAQCLLELRVARAVSRVGDEFVFGLGPHLLDEIEMTASAPSLVGENSAGDPIAPGEREIFWRVVETTPHREQHLRQCVVGVGRERAAAKVSLERLEDLLCDRLESLTTVALGIHSGRYVSV